MWGRDPFPDHDGTLLQTNHAFMRSPLKCCAIKLRLSPAESQTCTIINQHGAETETERETDIRDNQREDEQMPLLSETTDKMPKLASLASPAQEDLATLRGPKGSTTAARTDVFCASTPHQQSLSALLLLDL